MCTVAGCAAPAEPDAPVPLCRNHLLEAHEWTVGEFGLTDLLPSPCLACGSRLGVKWPTGWLCAVCEWRLGAIPDAELSGLRVDVVYYIRFQDRVKIGTSGNPRSRLSQLRHDELLAFERGDRSVEHRRHVQFAELRMARTEWFSLGPSLVEHIASLAVGDPWDRYARWKSEAIALRG